MQPIQFQFDVSAIAPYVGASDPLPTGSYPMAISNMECVANNKAETGHNLKIEYTVIEGEFKGRKVFENLNLWHKSSSQAVEIAFRHLSSIGHAVGVLAGGDLTVLAHKPMTVEVSLEPGTPAGVDANGQETKERKPQNRIQSRSPYSAQAASAAVSAAVINAAAAAQAPAMPASQPAAPAAQTAPAFSQPAAQPAATPAAAPASAPAAAQPTGTPGASTPPWMAK